MDDSLVHVGVWRCCWDGAGLGAPKEAGGLKLRGRRPLPAVAAARGGKPEVDLCVTSRGKDVVVETTLWVDNSNNVIPL